MGQRIVAIWFPHLMTDWTLRRQPELKAVPFALALTERGRRVVKAANAIAGEKGVHTTMVVADCKALVPDLHVIDYEPERPLQLLKGLGEWCLRYTPIVAVDAPDGLLLDASGCTHLWGGEAAYLKDIYKHLQAFGYHVRLAMADTIGAASALSRFGKNGSIVKPGAECEALMNLPPACLRLSPTIVERLEKLGLNTVGSFIKMPNTALRRRFGQELLTRINQALGMELELPDPVKPPAPYQERLPSMELIKTADGIEFALKTLLEPLCLRLSHESKGLRQCELQCYRVDGVIQQIEIGTSRPSRNTLHLFKLFEIKIPQIEPDMGIELFVLEARVVEDLPGSQDALWTISGASESAIAELLDKTAGITGANSIHRYLPSEHYWPERSMKEARSLTEQPTSTWRKDLPRPMHILPKPEQIEVSVPIPDYPPLLFKYKGVLHTVKKADGPERIEQEWWTDNQLYRDYYCVENEQGARYWLFRSGDYDHDDVEWFIHGFFA